MKYEPANIGKHEPANIGKQDPANIGVGVLTVCQVLNVSETTVRRMADRGVLPSFRDDRKRRRFSLTVVKQFARQRSKR